MQSSHRALRQRCRAPNAFSLASALNSTFSTASRLASAADWESVAHESKTPRIRRHHAGEGEEQIYSTTVVRPGQAAPAAKASTGAYASYEALADQFRGPTVRRHTSVAQVARRTNVNPKPRKDTSLAARQAVVDNSGRAAPAAHESGALPVMSKKPAEHIPVKRTEDLPNGSGQTRALRYTQHSRSKGQEKTFEQLPARAQAQLLGMPMTGAADRDSTRVMQRLGSLDRERTVQAYKAREARLSNIGERPDPADWKALMQWIGDSVFRATRAGIPSNAEAADDIRRGLDYEGRHIPPQAPTEELGLPMPWALPPHEAAGLSATEWLEQEMTRFAAYLQLTPAEEAARAAVVAEARAMAANKSRESHIKTELFGSSVTGLATAISDVDIRLHHAADYDDAPRLTTVAMAMGGIFRRFEASQDWICVVYRNAKFPIINAIHKATGIDMQFVCSPSSTPQQEATRQYLAELPHLRTLYPLVYTMLSTRGLLDVFSGGIGSYGLLMMLVASLKRRSTVYPTSLSDQLLHFLDFYTNGHAFDTTKHGITISPTPKLFLKHDRSPEHGPSSHKALIESAHRRHDPVRAGQWAISQRRPLQPYLLCLQDPANAVNDLGRKSNAIKHILATMKFVREGIVEEGRAIEEAGQGKGESMLGPVVGRVHEVYAERRARVEEYGRGILEGRNGAKEEAVGGSGPERVEGGLTYSLGE